MGREGVSTVADQPQKTSRLPSPDADERKPSPDERARRQDWRSDDVEILEEGEQTPKK